MRCVVTGSAGFLGSHLSEKLLRDGHTVIGIDAFTADYGCHIKAANQANLLAQPNFHFHARHLCEEGLDQIVANADMIYHLAGTIPGDWSHFEQALANDIRSTRSLLESLRENSHHLRRLVVVSSLAVYGHECGYQEGLTPRPQSSLGVNQLSVEMLCQAYQMNHQIPIVILRAAEVYGPRQRPDQKLYRWIESLQNAGEMDVSGLSDVNVGLLEVSDFISALILASEAPVGEIYNVHSDVWISSPDLISKLESCVGRAIATPESMPQMNSRAAEKIRRHLGWRPIVGLEEGLARQWNWQMNSAAMVPMKSFANST